MSGGPPELAGASRTPLWLAGPQRPAARPAVEGDLTVDLAVVGGGLTGVWTALQAVQQQPGRSVALVEGSRLAWAASGRNGGFCTASITHGLANGLARWPREMPTLLRLGNENLDGIEKTVTELGIECGWRRAGELTVAVADWQVGELNELAEASAALGEPLQWLDRDAVRERVHSPTYLAGLADPRGTATVDPAALLWGLAAAGERAGVQIRENSVVRTVSTQGEWVVLGTDHGRVRARQVVLATSAFRSPLRRVRPYVVPVWDHVLATRPLTAGQLAAIGWSGREGLSDAGNQFHYYRLTEDDRLVWGGYDAHYYYGSDLSARRARNPATEQLLYRNLVRTFPSLEGIGIDHVWAGAIDTSTRFSAFWRPALGGRLVAVQGFTGLGVGASRFAGTVALDLLAGRRTEATQLEMVRRAPWPFPPEPARWTGIQLTRHSLAKADASSGRRDVWLRTLDRLGLGFDS